MRYYSITVSDPNTGESFVPDGEGFARGSGPTFTSFVDGATDPGALHVEFDLPVTTFDVFQGGQRVKVHGVGVLMIGQAANLNGMNFSMSAGMAPGLPLADPSQAGIVLRGKVFQAYGNWQGTDQTLDFIVNPGTAEASVSTPIPFWWPAGTPLDEAIGAAISGALPGVKSEIFIDSRLVLANDEAGYYTTLSQFASYLKGITLKFGSQVVPGYTGVSVAWNGDTVNVFDGTRGGGPSEVLVPLRFFDLIGQPTWIGPTEVGFTTVLRADVGVGNRVSFPVDANGNPEVVVPYALTSPAAAVPNVPARSSTVFRGEFAVKEVHHFGSYRTPDADSWSTSFVAVPVVTP